MVLRTIKSHENRVNDWHMYTEGKKFSNILWGYTV